MSVLAIVGTKGSPGATTLALAIAASATAYQRPLVVEADPAGGDIAARAGLGLDPGLLTLAAAGRREVTSSLVACHTQNLASGVPVLLAPTSAEHAHSTLCSLSTPLTRLLTGGSVLAIVDAGRYDRDSADTELVSGATHTLLVLRPTVEAVEHARWQVRSLSKLVERLAVISVGDRPYPPAEVRAALEVDDIHVVDHDTRAAGAIGAGASVDRWLRRSALLRCAASLGQEHLLDVETAGSR